MITIRDYRESDAEVLWQLFFNTVRHVNRRDYTQAQVEAWATDAYDAEYWQKRMDGLSPFLAEIDGVVVGYTDLQHDGLIDHFFVHYQHQGKGVGKALMSYVLETGRKRSIPRCYSEVSITARPFYEHHGFTVVRENRAKMKDQILKYYLVEKFV